MTRFAGKDVFLLVVKEAPQGGPRSRNHADFLPFSRIHAINEKFRFSRKNAKIGQKNMPFTQSRMFLNGFTKSRKFFDVFTHHSRKSFHAFTQEKIGFHAFAQEKKAFHAITQTYGGGLVKESQSPPLLG